MQGRDPKQDDSIQPDELQQLLLLLHAPETPIEKPDAYATVAAVCEATGESSHRVWEVLEQIRQEDLEARIQQRLQDAEEPLYRVERPGDYRDPLDSTTNILARRRAVKTILDKLPRADKIYPKVISQQTDQPQQRAFNFAAFLVLAGTFVLIALVAIVAAIGVMHAMATPVR